MQPEADLARERDKCPMERLIKQTNQPTNQPDEWKGEMWVSLVAQFAEQSLLINQSIDSDKVAACYTEVF